MLFRSRTRLNHPSACVDGIALSTTEYKIPCLSCMQKHWLDMVAVKMEAEQAEHEEYEEIAYFCPRTGEFTETEDMIEYNQKMKDFASGMMRRTHE